MIPDPLTFDYLLPQDLIATTHAIPRDHSRLMVINRHNCTIDSSHYFYDLPSFLTSNDVLIVNETKVFPARLYGTKTTGGHIEVLLLEQLNLDTWRCISKPGLKINQIIDFHQSLQATVISRDMETGDTEIRFNISGNRLLNVIDDIGITPLPHYINSSTSESEIRKIYQTVYAQNRGSAAAPTAGLHFTPELLQKLEYSNIPVEKITLHVGLGTFQPLRSENLTTGKLHTEKYYIDPQVAARLTKYKQQGRRLIAVGTTTARTLESNPSLIPGWHETDIFIYPPYQFQLVDALITNFHLPQSSLLMMITAFASAPNPGSHFTQFKNSLIFQAYEQAIAGNFRFYSFGDAMLIC